VTQAENFINTVSPYEIDMPPVLDFEITGSSTDKDAVIREVNAFLNVIERYFGVKPIIYTTYESYSAYLTSGFDEYPLWFRDLFKKPMIEGGRDWLFWQYCNRGRLKGFDEKQKYIDLNAFNGTVSEFEAYTADIAKQIKVK
jgi:lysozyme